MTRTTTAPSRTTTPSTTSSGLRSLYLIRVAFSLIWVALVLATSASLVSTDEPTAIAAALLVVYPLWDAIATLLEQRLAGTGSLDRVGATNVVLGLAATAGMIAAAFATVATALLVFGVWALLSGACLLYTAQWPMVISGSLSVLAGASFAAMSASDTSGLSALVGYSAFGAFWFLVSVIALSVRDRRASR